MKFSNFRDYRQVGTATIDRKEYATVDKTTGYLWWKKTEPVRVSKSYYSTYWQFVDTGFFTPGFEIERLFDSYRMKEQDEPKSI